MHDPEDHPTSGLRPFTAGDHNMLFDALLALSDAEDLAENIPGDDAEALLYLLIDIRNALSHMKLAHSLDPDRPDSAALRAADDAEVQERSSKQDIWEITRQMPDFVISAMFDSIVEQLR